MIYTVSFKAIDGWMETRTFKTRAGAERKIKKHIGEHAEIGSTGYAVSFDGTVVGRVYEAETPNGPWRNITREVYAPA